MRIDVFTLFPGIVEGPLRESLLGKAIEAGVVDVRVHDIRASATDKHRQVDDEPYGGGPGMVLKPEPVFAAVESLGDGTKRVIVLSPAGRRLEQSLVRELAKEPWLVLISGRYEGVDERVVEGMPAEEVSIGDYVLSGGEIPALVVLGRRGRSSRESGSRAGSPDGRTECRSPCSARPARPCRCRRSGDTPRASP